MSVVGSGGPTFPKPGTDPSRMVVGPTHVRRRPPEEISGFERSSHFYERRADGDSYLRRSAPTYHVSSEPLRGRTRDRLFRNGPYTPIIESVVSRRTWSYESASSRYPPPASTPEVSYQDERRETTPVVIVHKKHSKSRLQCRSYCRSGSNGSGSDSGSNSGSSGSRSRSSSSQSGSSSCSSASSSPASDKSCSTHSHHGSLRSGVTLQSAVSTPHTNTSSPAVHSEDRRPLAICVRNLPARSSDTSLKDGLFHEYKKHGKVTWVKVVGQGADRYALVCFKKPEDVEKALQVSHDKLFFGCKIEVAPYQGYDVDDNEFRPYEAEQDEFHPKATRTLFIGNLEKDITAPELRKHFDQFGEIIEIDIKKQGATSTYAFCQYCDIGSVVRAMRTLDGEHLGNNRIKLGFGKSLHTNCVWVDGVAESVSEKYLILQFNQFGPVSQVAIDRVRGHALVFYDQIAFAQAAVKEMRGVTLRGRKLQVDFASRECQEAFYDHLEKQSNSFENSIQASPQGLVGGSVRGFETPSSSSSSSGGGGGRYVPSNIRYSTQQSASRSTPLYSRTGSNSGTSPGASTPSPSTPVRTTPRHQLSSRFDFTSEYNSERRPYRTYEELGGNEEGSGMVTVVVPPHDIRHLQKERVALLEQLEDCPSSGEEGNPRRRCKHRRSQSGEGGSSRPGTPLCDERPENLAPVEPRRTPRERPPDPLSLPLPRFASQVLSPRPAPHSPPASPPRPRSSSSDDSEPSPPSPEWEERLRSLDEKYEKWSGSRSTMAKVDASSLRIRHKLLDLDHHELPPSDIVKSVLAKPSVFDEDSKRLENFGEKYEPREFVPSRPGFAGIRLRLEGCSPLHSPIPKSPASSSSPAGAKGLQYPFPSHPPVQPTTSVATTTAAISMVSCGGALSSSSSSSLTVSSAETSKSTVTFPTSCVSTVTSTRQFPHSSTVNYPQPKISPTSPSDKKESAEVISRPVVSTPTNPSSVERSKSVQKTLCTKVDKCDTIIKKDNFPGSCKSVTKNSVCSRRESGEEKECSAGDGVSVADCHRKSKEERESGSCEVKQCADSVERKDIQGEGDKTKDTEMCDRRKRRASVDVKDSVCRKDSSESLCDKLKENNHRKDDRRRDSVDSNLRKDDNTDSCKLRLSETKKDCSSDNSETTSSTFECSRFSDYENLISKKHDSIERRKDSEEIVRHSLIEPLDKKKDIFGVCSEKDRRRGRGDSVDISLSDGVRLKKVPDNLEKKRDNETDSRHNRDKEEENKKPSIDHSFSERRKEGLHSDNYPKNNEISDKRKERESSDSYQESVRHKEKKDISEKERRKEKDQNEIVENSKHKSRRSPETPETAKHSSREVERRRSSTTISETSEASKSKDCIKNNIEYNDDSTFKHSDSKKDDCGPNIRHREHDNKRKETIVEHSDSSSKSHQKKEPDYPDGRHDVNFIYKEKRRDSDVQETSKHSERRKDSTSSQNSKIKDVDSKKEDHFDSVKMKDFDKRRDSDSQEVSVRYRDNDRKREGGEFDYNSKTKESEKKSEDSDYSRHREEKSKENEDAVKHKETDRKKEFDITENTRHRDLDRRKDVDAFDMIKNKDHDRKKEMEIVDYMRHKHAELKKEAETTDNSKHKECEKRRDHDIENSIKHRDIDRRKDSTDHVENQKHKEFEHWRSDVYDSLKQNSERKLSDSGENNKKKDNDRRKDSETENFKYKDYNDRKKDCESAENYKHRDSDRKREEKEKRKDRENVEGFSDGFKNKEINDERRKEVDREKIEKSRRNKENENHDRQKDSVHDYVDKRKESDFDKHQNEFQEKRKDSFTEDFDRKNEIIKKERRKEKMITGSWPAAIGCKRRLSSQDSVDSSVEDAKRSKPERRDSKDSGRSSSSSSKKSSGEKHKEKSFTKLLEEKIKEDKERESHRKKKDDDSLEEKPQKPANRKEKRNSSEKKKEERKSKSRRDTGSESETGSGDEEIKSAKKHSIFDIVDDEPAYISMYDKVKARSTKNMQKLEEEKRQERLKEKFSQLKQCRAKREEKKRSTSYDEDSDSERGGGGGASRRSNKMLILSSEEDGGSEGDVRIKSSRKIMSDTSEDDVHSKHNIHRLGKPSRIRSEDSESKSRKILSDTTDDDSLRLNILRVKTSRIHSFDNDIKGRKITSDTSEDDSLKHSSMKSKITRIHSDESDTEAGYTECNKTDDEQQIGKRVNESSDLFSNISEDHDHFGDNEIEADPRPPSSDSYRRNSIDSNPGVNEVSRKKSHKKKQKRQKSCEYNEDGVLVNKRHSSKKDRRKSAHSRDGDDEMKSVQNKIRKKKSDRDNSIKRDEKMEDIFGPLSDDSDKIIGKWQVSQVYGSDSESEREVQRKKEKRRKERKARELDEAGRALEAKLMDGSDGYMVSEEPTKSKKKKRKKSREEKVKHHHSRSEEEPPVLSQVSDLEQEPELEPEPERDPSEIEPEVKSSSRPESVKTIVLPPSLPCLIDSPPHISSHNKRPDIPGFGSQVDENIHETAVKSISESTTKPIEESAKPEEPITPTPTEEKPTPVISQEETEDAVAALLLEDAFGAFESYPSEETPKPDTPVSEPDLQIDTDPEDTFDPVDFSRPPRTPDLPPTYYRQQDTREGLEQRILALACPDNNTNQQDNPKQLEPPVIEVDKKFIANKDTKIDISEPKTAPKVQSPDVERTKATIPPPDSNDISNKTPPLIETIKHHELPAIIKQVDMMHPLKIAVQSNQQIKPLQNIQDLHKRSINLHENSLPINYNKTISSHLPTLQQVVIKPLKQEELKLEKRQIGCSPIQSTFLHNQQANIQSQVLQHQKSLPVQQINSVVNHQQQQQFQKVQTQQQLKPQPEQVNSLPKTATFPETPVNASTVHPPNQNDKFAPQPVTTPVTSHISLHQYKSPQNPMLVQQSKALPQSVIQQQEPKQSNQQQQKDLHIVQQKPYNQEQLPQQHIVHHNIQKPAPVLHEQEKTTQNLVPEQEQNKQLVPQIQLEKSSNSEQEQIADERLKNVQEDRRVLHEKDQLQPRIQQLDFLQREQQQESDKQRQIILPKEQAKKEVSQTEDKFQQQISLQQIPPLKQTIQAPVIQQPFHQQSKAPSPQPISAIKENPQQHLLESLSQKHTSPNVSVQVIQKPINAVQKDLSNRNETPGSPKTQKIENDIHKDTTEDLFDELKEDPFDKLMQSKPTKPDNFLHKPALTPPNLSTIKQLPNLCNQIKATSAFNKDLPILNDLSSKPVENHIESHKPIYPEQKIKENVNEVKPLNAVIQDLTYKAAMAKQAFPEEVKRDQLKPIDQVVKEIHQRIKDASNTPEVVETNKEPPLKVEKVPEIKEEIKTEPEEIPESIADEIQDPPVNSVDSIEKNDRVKETKSVIVTEGDVSAKQSQEPEELESKRIPDPEKIGNEEEEEEEEEVEIKKDTLKISSVVEEHKLEKVRIKKEDIMESSMSPDPVVAPLTPKMEEKGSAVFVNPGESSSEPCDLETAQTAKQEEIGDENVKEEPLVTTLSGPVGRGGRGGRRRRAVARGGGVVTRRTRLNNRSATSAPSADVYEFRDDSEEEAGRPRLILTIKSPPEPPPACSTRKSRRLLERDGTRSTVDDTIEDVIRGTRSSTRRGGRTAVSLPPPPPPAPETRKSPRRKQATPAPTTKEEPSSQPVIQRQASPQPQPQAQQQQQQPTPPTSQPQTTPQTPPRSTTPQPASQQIQPTSNSRPPTPQAQAQLPLPPPAAPTPSTTPSTTVSPLPPVTQNKSATPPSIEPMTLIDPVTGLLIPMRESEEGQYIPVNNDHHRNQMDTTDDDDTGEPSEKRMRTMSLPSEPTVPSSTPVVASPPPPRPVTVPPVRPGPVPSSPASVVKVLPLKTNATPSPVVVAKPNNIAANPMEIRNSVPIPTLTKTLPSGLTKPIMVSTGIVRPLLPSPGLSKPMLSPNMSVTKSAVMMSPKNSVPSAPTSVTVNRVLVTPTGSATTTGKSGVAVPPPASIGVGMATTPINHKAHLLQAVNRGKVPVAKVGTPMTPKVHILQSIGNAGNCGAREGVVGPGTPPPPHHGSLLTGSVASPPLRAHSQQPVVTGASSSRTVCKNLLEPGATPGGCIVVPSPPQPHNRGQVMQAGLPVPAYEASLHGVVAELLPNPQWPRQSPPPAHQHPAQAQGDVQHVNYIQPAHYQLMYQQYLREAAAAYQFTPGGVKAECEEGARSSGGSPPAPLELRRGSPHDRTTDSPQVATLYVHGARHLYYEGPHPPPAHRPSQPRLQVATPPHASQVPPQADSLLMLLQRYPVMWQGLLALKNDQAAVQMHFVFGNPCVARDSLPCNSDGSTPPLRIAQRMRLEQTQVEGVARKMQMDNEHCMLLALPCGRDHMDVLQQSNNLQSGFITYLQQKQAAGIVNIAAPGSQQAAYVVHIFPACDFANESLARIAPDLLHRVADIAHLLIVIATV